MAASPARPGNDLPADLPADGPVRAGSGWAWALVVWTLLVWGGRVRNALGDPALRGGGRTGPLLLAATFLVPALALGVLLVLARRPGGRGGGAVPAAVGALALWTVAVWVVRATDIVVGGDHPVPFVVVHVVLAAVSTGLAVAAVRQQLRGRSVNFVTVGRNPR